MPLQFTCKKGKEYVLDADHFFETHEWGTEENPAKWITIIYFKNSGYDGTLTFISKKQWIEKIKPEVRYLFTMQGKKYYQFDENQLKF